MSGVDAIKIRWELPKEQRHLAALLYYEAFSQKMKPFIGLDGRAVSMLEDCFDGEMAIIALDHDRLVGLAGLAYKGRGFFTPTFADFARRFGWLGGLIRAVAFTLIFWNSQEQDSLYLDDLAVDVDARGQGIGTRLVEATLDLAREKGKSTVRLDVVDTNPDARRLYERLGFVPVRTRKLPFLRRRLGFSTVTTMVKEV